MFIASEEAGKEFLSVGQYQSFTLKIWRDMERLAIRPSSPRPIQQYARYVSKWRTHVRKCFICYQEHSHWNHSYFCAWKEGPLETEEQYTIISHRKISVKSLQVRLYGHLKIMHSDEVFLAALLNPRHMGQSFSSIKYTLAKDFLKKDFKRIRGFLRQDHQSVKKNSEPKGIICRSWDMASYR